MHHASAVTAFSEPAAPKRGGGPRTPEGRATSATNARSHGLAGRHACLPDEDPAEFIELLDGLQKDLQPVGLVEHLLVRKMAEADWRGRRAARFEAEALEAENAAEDGAGMAVYRDAHKAGVLTIVTRYGGAAERGWYAALHELERRQAARKGAQVALPVALDVTVSAATVGDAIGQ